MKKILPYLLALAMTLIFGACTIQGGTQDVGGSGASSQVFDNEDDKPVVAEPESADNADISNDVNNKLKVKENGSYTDKERVALYIHTYGRLPNNFITKAEAQKLGWDSSAGNLRKVAPGKSIGGDRFGNYEGQLPKAKKRKYFECDIDYGGGRRNGKRIVFSSDGLVFYTGDHYKTFEQLY